ncbi:hypothetical protein [Candidatus Competibacter phosphatis]|uniref:hypothetical protein n=1 Tax=Candidatus Competibacter phosphatis TaxID=221280 RepID=UPI001FE5E0BC|nr:hypothetical protein [Candidatus Competibacter phosphatis]
MTSETSKSSRAQPALARIRWAFFAVDIAAGHQAENVVVGIDDQQDAYAPLDHDVQSLVERDR